MKSLALEDVLVEVKDHVGVVTINRPDRMNAFRAQTIDELIDAFRWCWANNQVRTIVFTGSGERAFCVGGDVKQRAETGDYGPSRDGIWDVEYFHRLIRQVPKPVIAAVNGYAIGGGHVFHVLCDLSIASETAVFGQVGPKVGSFDAGFGAPYLARLVGEKRAREIWFLCRQYTAQQALEMGLVNAVVPKERLLDEAFAWGAEMALLSPTALKMLKYSFNTDTEHFGGLANFAQGALDLYVNTEEAREGVAAFLEKRSPRY